MASDFDINIRVRGQEAAKRAVKDVAAGAKQLQHAAQPNAGAASAWNPYVAALQKVHRAQQRAADAARKLADNNRQAVGAGAASAWNPHISAVKRYEMAQKATADALRRTADAQKAAASAGNASAWSPAISAAKRYEAALKDINAVQKRIKQDAALGGAARYVPAGGGIHQLNQRLAARRSAMDERYGEVADTSRNVGAGALAIGGASVAALLAGAMEAGKVKRAQQAISSYEGGAELFEGLKKLDAESTFNFGELVGGAQSALAQDFKASEILPLFYALGDAVIKAGGGMEQFNAALVQIAQVKTKGVASMQDIRAMAEGAKLPIIPILKAALGQERTAGILSGDEPIEAGQFLDIVMKGLRERSGGGMADAMRELPGQIDELKGSAYMLGVELSAHLIPLVGGATKMLTGITKFFRSLPEPLKAIAVHQAAVTAVIVTIGGAIGLMVAPFLSIASSVKVLTGAGGVATLATGLNTVPAAVTTATTAITGAGGLISVLTVALPAAIALAAGLILKAGMDKVSRDEDSRAAGVDTVATPGQTRSALLSQADKNKEAQAELDKRIADRTWVRNRTGWLNPFEMKTRAAITKEIEGLEAEKKALQMAEASLRRRAATAPETIPTTSKTLGIQIGSPGTPTGTSFSGGTIGTSGGMTDVEAMQVQQWRNQLADAKDKEKAQLAFDIKMARLSQTIAKRNQAAVNKSKRERERDRKKAEADAKRREREAERAERDRYRGLGMGADVAAARTRADADLQTERLRLQFEQRQDAARQQLEAQIEALGDGKNAGKKADKLREAFERREKALQADMNLQIARIEAQAQMAEAQVQAQAEQDPRARARLLQIAQIRSNAIIQQAQLQKQFAGNAGANPIAEAVERVRRSRFSGALGEVTRYQGMNFFGSARSFGLQGLGDNLPAANMGAGLKPFGTANMAPLAGSGRRKTVIELNQTGDARFVKNGAEIELRLNGAVITIPNTAAQLARARH